MRALAIAAVIALFAGCGDKPVEPPVNERPRAVGTIPPLNIFLQDTTVVSLSGYFSDPDGDALTYTSTSSNQQVVTTSIGSAAVRVAPVGKGEATVTVTASDPDGLSAQQSFPVTVVNRAPLPVDSIALLETEVGDSASFAVSGYFSDPDGDSLTYAAASSDRAIATATIQGDILRVDPVAEGEATITLTATDPDGASAEQSFPVRVAPDPQRVILAALYESMGGAGWTRSHNWLTDAGLDTWHGVEIDGRGEIRSLNLADNQLSGTIPPSLGGLSTLRHLDLSNNRLEGTIPPELGALSQLRRLYVLENRLTGPLPAELGNLSGLEHFIAWKNDFTGPVPPELGNLGSLIGIDVSHNDLEGPLPNTLVELDALQDLLFHNNPDLCAPGSSSFVRWIDGLDQFHGPLCNEPDRTALEVFHSAAGGPRWTNAGGWGVERDLSRWHGVRTDSLGFVTGIDLEDNRLHGTIASEVGNLSGLTELEVGGNELTGALPLSLTGLSLDRLGYADTRLCTPNDDAFREWLGTIPSHEGTGEECADPRDALAALYEATDGANWFRGDNWMSDAPLGEWYGVIADAHGQIVELRLSLNGLAGHIPPELGSLNRLQSLDLGTNRLEGPIPPELGSLHTLQVLHLAQNNLTGAIPPGLSQLSRLHWLDLSENRLTGPIPAGLGDLSRLSFLSLAVNDLDGPIPAPIANLSALRRLIVDHNRLSGPIPGDLGDLRDLTHLALAANDLSGPIPPELARLRSLEELELSNNPDLTGTLRPEFTSLTRLLSLVISETGVCVPPDTEFRAWLAGIPKRRFTLCEHESPAAYLVQSVQSRDHPVPLVADRDALLRVFVTASRATEQGIPLMRAHFYVDGTRVHTETIPGKSTPIPTEVDEGSLAKSANAEVPGRIVQPGLEMVIEVDPEGTLDEDLGVPGRIPDEGRLALEVHSMPLFDLTLIPFLWQPNPDSSVLGATVEMVEDQTDHELLRVTHDLLPIGDMEVSGHPPVEISSNNAYDILDQVEIIRAMEGASGHYMGLMAGEVTGAAGLAQRPGRASFAVLHDTVIAHELGHNLSLLHAPCGGALANDPGFPHPDAMVGSWGFDYRNQTLVPPTNFEIMSGCKPQWISDYFFTNAIRFRATSGDADRASGPRRSLLLWGGLDEEGAPVLKPAFVVDAPPVVPSAPGAHTLTGRDDGGGELFSLSFEMPEIADGEGESASFVFMLPVDPGWAGALASITLAGPGGSVTLDGDTDLPMTIVRDRGSGQVRAIWSGMRAPPAGRTGLEVFQSRGIPGRESWER